MKKRSWPWWLRFLLAVAITVLFYKLYAGWHWQERVVSGRGVYALSPTGTVIRHGSALTLATTWLEHMRLWSVWGAFGGQQTAWNLAYALSAILPAALIGTLAYVALTRWFRRGPLLHDQYTRCRRCDYILAGLSEPRCPECGERI